MLALQSCLWLVEKATRKQLDALQKQQAACRQLDQCCSELCMCDPICLKKLYLFALLSDSWRQEDLQSISSPEDFVSFMQKEKKLVSD